jgi:hypothetical protein
MIHVDEEDADFAIGLIETFSDLPSEQDSENNALTRKRMTDGCQKSRGFSMQPRSAHCITGATGHDGGRTQLNRNRGLRGCNASVLPCSGASDEAKITRQRVPSGIALRIANASPTCAASFVSQPPLSTMRAVMTRASRESSRTTTRDGADSSNTKILMHNGE